jgi:hypothetical protein
MRSYGDLGESLLCDGEIKVRNGDRRKLIRFGIHGRGAKFGVLWGRMLAAGQVSDWNGVKERRSTWKTCRNDCDRSFDHGDRTGQHRLVGL